jgi:hypothetical protein
LIDPFEGITKNLIIVGTPKCATNSLEQYLRDRFPQEVRRIEVIWRGQEGVDDTVYRFPPDKWQYIITMRNNVDRIWSNYYYFQMNDKMSLEDYLKYDHSEFSTVGIGNPIKQGQYHHWFSFWAKYDPIIITVEQMNKLPGFPHLNKTGDRRNYPEITESDKNLIISYLYKGVENING